MHLTVLSTLLRLFPWDGIWRDMGYGIEHRHGCTWHIHAPAAGRSEQGYWEVGYGYCQCFFQNDFPMYKRLLFFLHTLARIYCYWKVAQEKTLGVVGRKQRKLKVYVICML